MAAGAVVALVLLAGCDEGDGQGGDCTQDVGVIELDNQTGNVIDTVIFYPCDMSDPTTFPIPDGGLADGDSISLGFPGPGCWFVRYQGEGCHNDPAEQVDIGCGESHDWLADDENHVCAGG